jgi:hypothetical protein
VEQSVQAIGATVISGMLKKQRDRGWHDKGESQEQHQ